jgi:hypothetical protein
MFASSLTALISAVRKFTIQFLGIGPGSVGGAGVDDQRAPHMFGSIEIAFAT